MNAIKDFDRHAEAFLAEGPTELSDRVLDAALREVHRTRQARRGLIAPRRFVDMSRVGRLAAAAVVAVVAGVSVYTMLGWRVAPGSTSSPAVQSSPSRSTTPGTSTATVIFTSPQYRYEVSIPTTWTTTLATAAWPGGDGIESDGEPYLDQFRLEASPTSAGVSVKAQVVPSGTTQSSWFAQFESIRAIGGLCFGSATPWTDATVAGLRARRFGWRCDGSPGTNANYDEYTFLVGRSGFVIHGDPSMVAILVQSFRVP